MIIATAFLLSAVSIPPKPACLATPSRQAPDGWTLVTGNPSIAGTLEIRSDFPSKVLGNSRPIRVWLPPGYASQPNRHYPVLYMMDGQNLFDPALSPFSHAEWRCDENAEGLIDAKVIPPIIIVGVDNLDRTNEYLPVYDPEIKAGGKAKDFLKFLVQEVKPMIDQTFRTKTDRASTGIGGSSLGAVISIYAAIHRPDVFSDLILMSTASWPSNHEILDEVAKWKPKPGMRIWEDVGTAEGRTDPGKPNQQLVDSNRLAELLRQRGFAAGKNFAYFIDSGAPHSETAWQERFGMALMFLYRH